jgi:hypothetical protein
MGKRLAILTAMATIIVILIIDFLYLGRAWSIWADGRSAARLKFWGWQIVWWGRFGKICIALSGLAIILDLIDPKYLRNKGRAAKRRLRGTMLRVEETDKRRELEDLLNDIEGCVIFLAPKAVNLLTARYTSNGGSAWVAFLSTPSDTLKKISALVRQEPRLDEDILRSFYDAVVPKLHAMRSSDQRSEYGFELREDQRDFIRRSAKHLLLKMITAEERTLLEGEDSFGRRVKALSENFWPLLFFGSAFVALLCGAIAAHLIDFPLAFYLSMPLAVCIFYVLIFFEKSIDRLLIFITAGPTIVVAGGLAAVLDMARPGHVFRWVAFILFILGSHFDLLAS